MTVEELLTRCSSAELTEWAAHMQLSNAEIERERRKRG